MKKISIGIAFFFLLGNLQAQVSNARVYAFGHSLMDHRPPAIPTPSDETTIFHWMHDIAKTAGKEFAAGGQYGFLTSHDNLPPSSQWGYDNVPAVWDQEIESFSEAEINTVLITPANFIQYVSPAEPHPLDKNTSVIESTETIFDWVNNQNSEIRYYIYGNWPEMDLVEAFPPNIPLQLEIDTYHSLSLTQSETWWKPYQDAMLNSRPEYNTRLIPVGAILSKLLSLEELQNIPFSDIYEDSAPHGRPSLYFLAAMISYMAIFEDRIPTSYLPSALVHETLVENLSFLNDFIWTELMNFNLDNGESRVFYNTISGLSENETSLNVQLFPNPCRANFTLRGLRAGSRIQILNVYGEIKFKAKVQFYSEEISIVNFPNGIYYVQIVDENNEQFILKRIVKTI